MEAALDSRRNIVPVMFEGFDFGNPKIARRLTGKLALLKQYNALPLPATAKYFESAMDSLRKTYLNVPLDAVLHPASSRAVQFAEKQKATASSAPVVTESELVKEVWYERGLNAGAKWVVAGKNELSVAVRGCLFTGLVCAVVGGLLWILFYILLFQHM